MMLIKEGLVRHPLQGMYQSEGALGVIYFE